MAINGDEPRDTTGGDGTDNDEEAADGAVAADDRGGADGAGERVDWRHPGPEQGAERVPNGLVWHNPGFIPRTRRPVSTHRLDEDLERHFDSGAVAVTTTARDDEAARDDGAGGRIPPEQPAGPDRAGADSADDVDPDEDILD